MSAVAGLRGGSGVPTVGSMPRSLAPRIATVFAAALLAAACGGSTPPPKAVEAPPPASDPPPAGPTRTDVKQIAKTLVAKCVAGGWISKWRSTNPDYEAARPKIKLEDFEDKTGQSIDTTYMTSELERRMSTSGVFDMVTEAPDFVAHGKLLRLAERGKGGARISVYTAVLDLHDPATGKRAYGCEATVEGEL